MEGVSIVSTELLQDLIHKVEYLHKELIKMNKERDAGLSVWMTTAQVRDYINKSNTWIALHKHELGFTKRAGTLLFKRAAIDEYLGEDWFKIGEEPIVRPKRTAKRR